MVDVGKAFSAVVYACFSIAGAAVAYLYFHGAVWPGLIAVIAAIILGYLLGNVIAQRLLPDRPVAALACLEFWVLAPGGFATLVAALLIIVGVALSAPEHAPAEQSKTLEALSGGLTALITAVFLKIFKDADDDVVGSRVKEVFQAHYKRYKAAIAKSPGIARFNAGSEGENWVYSDSAGIEGWGLTARHKRARGIAERLATTDRAD